MACSSASLSSTSEVTRRRGIPAAQFVEDVQKYLTQSGLDVNPALSFFQERLQQCKLVEMKLLAQQRDLLVLGVTIARVYNWDVHQRRTQQSAAAAATKLKIEFN